MPYAGAAYNIGGHTISADTIQNTILRCRLPRPGQVVHATPTFPSRKIKRKKNGHSIYNIFEISPQYAKNLSCKSYRVTYMEASSYLYPLVVVSLVLFSKDKIQSWRWTTSIPDWASWASSTLCTLFRKPFWSSGTYFYSSLCVCMWFFIRLVSCNVSIFQCFNIFFGQLLTVLEN